jgi:predicted transcriptional regulator
LRNSDNPINANAENYYNKCFVPYKKYNELLVIAQKAIMSYYLNKGTEKENEFSQMNNEIESKINELNDEFLTKDLESMQILDAINIFKKKNYYVRMLKCYLLKIKLLKNNIFESNELIEEMCYFILFQSLKRFLSSKNPLQKKEKKKGKNL